MIDKNQIRIKRYMCGMNEIEKHIYRKIKLS